VPQLQEHDVWIVVDGTEATLLSLPELMQTPNDLDEMQSRADRQCYNFLFDCFYILEFDI
jgi:hypothetical protein